MWPSRDGVRRRLSDALMNHAEDRRRLPGVADPRALHALVMQFVASLRREDYYLAVQRKAISARRADPNDASFDPERAVAYHMQQGDVDEAAWLLFLMTHFARPANEGWLRLRDVYGALGAGVWNWAAVSPDCAAFATWLDANWRRVRGKFGNHRKYESLRPDSARNMGRVVADYVRWIGGNGHARFFADVIRRGGNDPFNVLFHDMAVASFGRLAKFDYLMLLSRYHIAPIAPSSAYLEGATGPRLGADLLFTGDPRANTPAATLQRMLDTLDSDLGVGMAVMEDALCNWQKEPLRFVHYKG
jgi:hypothetical protein